MDAAGTAAEVADRLRAGELLCLRAPIGWVALGRPSERERLTALPGARRDRLGITAGSLALLREFLPPHGLRAERMLGRLLPGPAAIRLADEAPLARLDAWSPEGGPWLVVPLDLAHDREPPAPAVGGVARIPALVETTVRLDGPRWRVEAEGALGAERVAEAARLRLLFVCSGNTCRSPMLGALTRYALVQRGIAAVDVDSAGVHAGEGESATEHAVAVMAARGVALAGHRSRPLDRIDLAAIDRIWCLGRGHLAALQSFGVPAERLRLVNAAGGGVPDPFGGDLAAYEACAAVLERAVDEVLADLERP